MKKIIIFILILFFYSSTPLFGIKDMVKEDIYEHYLLGSELFQKGDYEGALLEYENILQIAPEYVQIYTLLGKVEYERKEYLKSAYYLTIAVSINPDDRQASILLDKLRESGRLVETGPTFFVWNFKDVPDSQKISYKLYGDSRYEKYLLNSNKLKKFTESGNYRIPVDFSNIKKLRVYRSFDGKIMAKELNQLRTKMIAEKEFDLSPERDPEKYFGLINDYLKLGKTFNAIMVYEDLVYFHPTYMDKLDASVISKMVGEINNYLLQNPDNARAYYFKAFLQFVRGKYDKAMSTFFVAQGLNLDAKYMKRKIKYMQFCRKRIKEHEEIKAKYRASLIVKNKVKDSNIMKRLDEEVSSVKNPDLSKEEIEYRCSLNRNLIERAVDAYNQDHIEEMDETNFSLRKLYNFQYLKKIPICPEGGKYRLLFGGIPECSIHGK